MSPRVFNSCPEIILVDLNCSDVEKAAGKQCMAGSRHTIWLCKKVCARLLVCSELPNAQEQTPPFVHLSHKSSPCLFIFFNLFNLFHSLLFFICSFVRLLTVYLVCYLVSWLPGCLLGWSSSRLLLCCFVPCVFVLLACFYLHLLSCVGIIILCMYVLVRYTCIYVCYFRDLELRRGEVMVDCLTEVEDTKGNVSNSGPT